MAPIKFLANKSSLLEIAHKKVIKTFLLFLCNKTNRCTKFTNLFCHETLHVSDSSYVHHQEFIHCSLSNVICHTGL